MCPTYQKTVQNPKAIHRVELLNRVRCDKKKHTSEQLGVHLNATNCLQTSRPCPTPSAMSAEDMTIPSPSEESDAAEGGETTVASCGKGQVNAKGYPSHRTQCRFEQADEPYRRSCCRIQSWGSMCPTLCETLSSCAAIQQLLVYNNSNTVEVNTFAFITNSVATRAILSSKTEIRVRISQSLRVIRHFNYSIIQSGAKYNLEPREIV